MRFVSVYYCFAVLDSFSSSTRCLKIHRASVSCTEGDGKEVCFNSSGHLKIKALFS